MPRNSRLKHCNPLSLDGNLHMTILNDYHHFNGLHWETGTLANALAYQGVKAPHSGQPLSEALLFGISGGIVAGYFTFEYAGHEPWLHFTTRMSFDPMQVVIERLGIQRQIKQTDKPEKGVQNLIEALDTGKAAIVWADTFSLPYTNLKSAKDMWGNLPVVVYGYDAAADRVYIADRPRVGVSVATAELAAARARVRSNKHRLMILDSLDVNRLPETIETGIRACIGYFLQPAPLKPMQGKFGLDAFTRWADLLVDSKKKEGWAKAYPGAKLYPMLKSAYHYINLWGTDHNGARGLYADFLDEAANIMGKPALKQVASQYRALTERWQALSRALLPDQVTPLQTTRELMEREYELYMSQGNDSLTERRQIGQRLQAIRDAVAADFPMTDSEVTAFRENLRVHVMKVHDAEKVAVEALQSAIA